MINYQRLVMLPILISMQSFERLLHEENFSVSENFPELDFSSQEAEIFSLICTHDSYIIGPWYDKNRH